MGLIQGKAGRWSGDADCKHRLAVRHEQRGPQAVHADGILHGGTTALYDLIDALLSVESVSSPVHLSATPTYRRRWGSFYAALAKGRLDVDALRALVAQHPLPAHRPIYAIDSSVWPRCAAETSPARGYSYHPSRHSAGQPMVTGCARNEGARLACHREGRR
jgi:hypothetical protein